jgi:hypothetical protein
MMISDYELKRIANIEKNNEYLHSLGLPTISKAIPQARGSKRPANQRKRNELVEELPRRKSSRLSDKEPVNYKEDSLQVVRKVGEIEDKTNDPDVTPDNMESGIFVGLPNSYEEESLKNAAGHLSQESSVSVLSANIDLFLNEYLCKPVPEYGKITVMQMSNYGKTPKFNKYPGVIEWKNCLYLWVNIGGKTGYTNTFSEKGRFMMWYGGSKMKADSRVTLRLIHPSNRSKTYNKSIPNVKEEESKSTSSPSYDGNCGHHRILLFVRLENENYCCLGEVAYVAIDLEQSPIKIKWELKHFDQISSEEYFQRMLSHSLRID